MPKTRLTIPLSYSNVTRKSSNPVSMDKSPLIRVYTDKYIIEFFLIILYLDCNIT
jgi:hypothetical protein